MKQTVDGVEFDTEHAEQIANHDAEDNKTAAHLHRTKEGRYFLHNEKLQIRQRGVWRDTPMDGTAYPLPKGSVRFVGTIKPLSESEAIDWFIETNAPQCLASAIQELIGGKVVSVELGELAEPFARYCKSRKIESAIVLLQTAVATRFGRDFDTDSGRGTIYISHDGVNLTNPHSSIVAQRAGSIARQLTGAKARLLDDVGIRSSQQVEK